MPFFSLIQLHLNLPFILYSNGGNGLFTLQKSCPKYMRNDTKTTPHDVMKSDQPDDKETRNETSGDRLIYFAAERTLLSWIRVSLAFMALGFVVDRFELFLKNMMVRSMPDLPNHPITSWIGIMLVLVGVVANVAAAIKFIRFETRYQRKTDTRPGHGLMLGVFLTVTASVLGILLIFFLILTLQ